MENTRDERDELVVYEVGYLILPSVAEDKVSGVVESIRKVVTKEGGVEIDSEAPFKYPLAYPMSKTIGASRYVVNDAYLGWIKFEASADKITTIDSGIRKIDEILRFLLLKAPRKSDFTFAKAMTKTSEDENETEEKEPEVVPTIDNAVIE